MLRHVPHSRHVATIKRLLHWKLAYQSSDPADRVSRYVSLDYAGLNFLLVVVVAYISFIVWWGP